MSSSTPATTPTKASSSALLKSRSTGFEGTLTESQAKGLAELKLKIDKSEYKVDFAKEPGGDRFLLQFLRATMKDKGGERIFQVDAAEERLIGCFKWRREYGLDEVRDMLETGKTPDGYEVFSKLYPAIDVINEETGQLVRFQRFGRFISVVDISCLTMHQWIRGFAYESFSLQKKLRELSVKHGREISMYAVVSDAGGISMVGVANRISFVKMMSGVASDHFPEMMGQTFLVNCPWIFPTIFAVAKPFIDKDIVAKFIIASDAATEAVQKLMPIDQIPKEYGGTSDAILPPVEPPPAKST